MASSARALMALVLPACLVLGCYASWPPENVELGKISSIRDVVGTCQNLGKSGKGSPTTYLSKVIWPNVPTSVHETIQAIAVQAMGDTGLFVRAYRDSEVVKEQVFVNGKDFELHSGRILIKYQFGAYANRKQDDSLPGVMGTSVALGVDKKGQGKYESNQSSPAGSISSCP